MTDVGDLLALDPGIVSPGAALFRNGKLVAAAQVKFAPTMSYNAAQRCIEAADAVMAWGRKVGANPVAITFEWPQIYSEGKGKGNPNQLTPMVGVNLSVATAYMIAAAMRKQAFDIKCYTPAEWIGQLPKSTRGRASSSPRAARILSRLDDDERAVVPDQHDAIDAVGIGLHALGRLGVRRVLTSS